MSYYIPLPSLLYNKISIFLFLLHILRETCALTRYIIISFNNAHARDIEKVDVKYCENAMKSGGTVAYGATEQGHIRLILLYDDGIYRYTIDRTDLCNTKG